MHSVGRGLGMNLLGNMLGYDGEAEGFEEGFEWSLRTACEDDPFDVGFVGEFVARDRKMLVTTMNVILKLTAFIPFQLNATAYILQEPKPSLTSPRPTRRPRHLIKTVQNKRDKNSQHAPIPPEPLRGNVQAAADGAAFIVRPPHVDDQHRGDLHREDHLRALLGHDSCFEARGWEGGVPWLLLFLLLLRGLGVLLGGGCHCGWFGGACFVVVLVGCRSGWRSWMSLVELLAISERGIDWWRWIYVL